MCHCLTPRCLCFHQDDYEGDVAVDLSSTSRHSLTTLTDQSNDPSNRERKTQKNSTNRGSLLLQNTSTTYDLFAPKCLIPKTINFSVHVCVLNFMYFYFTTQNMLYLSRQKKFLRCFFFLLLRYEDHVCSKSQDMCVSRILL